MHMAVEDAFSFILFLNITFQNFLIFIMMEHLMNETTQMMTN